MEQPTLIAVPEMLRQAKKASFKMAALPTDIKNEALLRFSELIEQHAGDLLAANEADIKQAQADALSATLYQRLKLDPGKIRQLVQGIRDVAKLPDPSGQIQSRTLLDDGLVLTRQTVPIGVIAVIFESRPDVIPQILSLMLKSGNVAVLKGGKEALHTNRAFMQLVDKLQQSCPALPAAWAQLLDSREAIHEVLKYPEYVDLVIPRGSNQLVQSVMAATSIPVLGHADGVCHLYAHASADFNQAIPLILDSKTQYPAACNALETLLVDADIAPTLLPRLSQAAQAAQVTLKGCEATRQMIPTAEPATEADWRTEYGEPVLSIKVIAGLEAAIDHINRYGSHHTDGILATDPDAQARFVAGVDSAGVYVNASTRFADGFRYGLGAEVGISTAKTHARGPVGLEGLVIYKYILTGQGHCVSDYTGEQARPFRHEVL